MGLSGDLGGHPQGLQNSPCQSRGVSGDMLLGMQPPTARERGCQCRGPGPGSQSPRPAALKAGGSEFSLPSRHGSEPRGGLGPGRRPVFTGAFHLRLQEAYSPRCTPSRSLTRRAARTPATDGICAFQHALSSETCGPSQNRAPSVSDREERVSQEALRHGLPSAGRSPGAPSRRGEHGRQPAESPSHPCLPLLPLRNQLNGTHTSRVGIFKSHSQKSSSLSPAGADGSPGNEAPAQNTRATRAQPCGPGGRSVARPWPWP